VTARTPSSARRGWRSPRRSSAAAARFLYLTATPAVDFDDLEHFVGLREWTAGAGFEDYRARVTGTAPEASGGPRGRRQEFNRLLDQ
jgi:hypothetical protein